MTFDASNMPISSVIMLLRSLLLLALTILHISTSNAGTPESRAYTYSSKPWPIRYFLHVESVDGITGTKNYATETNSRIERGTDESEYLHYEELFSPIRIINTPSDKFALVLLTFSQAGELLTPAFSRFHLSAKKSGLGNLVLLKNGIGDIHQRPYHFALWWELPGHHIMSPAVCDGSALYRYEIDDPAKNGYVGGFGCREWSAKLQDEDRPYIDVTSYYVDYNVISGFVGWSGFEHKPKPVIGKDMNTWICLHDCPNGEEPGIISNIVEWTKKHGFPMPVRPKRQPEYPNSMFQNIYQE